MSAQDENCLMGVSVCCTNLCQCGKTNFATLAQVLLLEKARHIQLFTESNLNHFTLSN